MKCKQKNGAQSEVPKETTSQGTSSPSKTPSQPLSSKPEEERESEKLKQVAEVLHQINLWELPDCLITDTIRGLIWSFDAAFRPKIEPREQHHIPFNVSLSEEAEALRQAAMNEVWRISADLFYGLQHLQTRGFVDEFGFEFPAGWSPGDVSYGLELVRDALGRLDTLKDKLYHLTYGTPIPKAH
jgi:hypothetical protein